MEGGFPCSNCTRERELQRQLFFSFSPSLFSFPPLSYFFSVYTAGGRSWIRCREGPLPCLALSPSRASFPSSHTIHLKKRAHRQAGRQRKIFGPMGRTRADVKSGGPGSARRAQKRFFFALSFSIFNPLVRLEASL